MSLQVQLILTGLVNWAEGWSGSVIITATAFGCGGEHYQEQLQFLIRRVLLEFRPNYTNQNRCVSENIATIRYEIL